MAVDVYLAVGHGLRPDGVFDPGAVGPDFIEHDKAFEVVQRTARALERCGVTFFSEHHAGPSHDPNHVGSAVAANASGAKLAIEVHFNSNDGQPGTGTEALFLSDAGKKFAIRASKLVAQALDLRDRGAKPRPELKFLRSTKMTASLVEVCFVNNATDRAKFRATPTGEAIARAVCEHLGKTFVPAP